MSLAKRLTKIETSLTPKQAVLLWLEEVQQLEGDDFLEECQASPIHEAPRSRIPEMAEKAVRDSLRKKGWTWESTSEPALKAWKQADFLVVLVHQLNEAIMLDALQSTPYLKLLLVELGWMEEKHEEHRIFARWGGWRALFIETLALMLLLRATIKAVSKQNYDNHSVLFPNEGTTLELGIRFAELLANGYNALEGALPAWTAIDLAALQSSIEAEVPAAVAEQVARAKAKTLQALGEWKAAWDLEEPDALAKVEKLRSSRAGVQNAEVIS